MKLNFSERCYLLLRKVPKGKVTTYTEIARALNSKSYRAVGNAMRKNKNHKIPCHRVVKSNGEIGNYNLGIKKKIEILRKEGVQIKNSKINFDKYLYKFK